MTATGWTWDYVLEQMTLPRLYALFDHWAVYPPAYIGIKIAFLGSEEAAPAAGKESDSNNVAELKFLPGVEGNWRGPAPMSPDQVKKMAEEMRNGR